MCPRGGHNGVQCGPLVPLSSSASAPTHRPQPRALRAWSLHPPPFLVTKAAPSSLPAQNVGARISGFRGVCKAQYRCRLARGKCPYCLSQATGKVFSVGESGAAVSMVTSAASAHWHPSHAGAGRLRGGWGPAVRVRIHVYCYDLGCEICFPSRAKDISNKCVFVPLFLGSNTHSHSPPRPQKTLAKHAIKVCPLISRTTKRTRIVIVTTQPESNSACRKGRGAPSSHPRAQI